MMKARGTQQWDVEPELEPADMPASKTPAKQKRVAAQQTPVQPAAKPKQVLTPLGAPLAMDDIEAGNAATEAEPFVEQQIEAEDLQAVALMYDDLMKAVPNRSPAECDRMITAFDNHLQMVMQALDERLGEIPSPYVRSVEVLQAKYGIMDIVVQELCAYLDKTVPAVAPLTRGLFAVQADLLSAAQPAIVACMADGQRELEKEKLRARNQAQRSPQVEAKYEAKPAPGQPQPRTSHKSISKTTEKPAAAARPSAPQQRTSKPPSTSTQKRWEPDKTWSELVKSTFSGLKKEKAEEEPQEEVVAPNGTRTVVVKREKGVVEKVVEKEGFRLYFNTESPPPKHRYRIREQEEKKQQALLDSRPQPGRHLSQRGVVDLIEDIYASKIKYDQQCRANNLPLETMGQHVYTFLSQRYGLAKLVKDWMDALQIGVKKYSADCVDVRVFAHIINNDIDEDFRFVHSQVKVTTGDLLRVYLRGKYPSKSEKELSDMVQTRITGLVPEDEWNYVIRNLYNAEDAAILCEEVYSEIERNLAQEKKTDKRHPFAKSTAKKDLCQADFKLLMERILSFQLNGHLRFLGKFRHLFRLFDADEDGVLNQDQTVDLLLAVNADLSPELVMSILEAADPGDTHQFTFSQCVGIVSSQLVRTVQQQQEPEQEYEDGYVEEEDEEQYQ